jgi:4-hydroxybenzoate polyprenyltransferase
MHIGSVRTSWRRPSRVAAVVKLARPRYLALTLTPFLVGTTASDVHSDIYVVLGATAMVLLRAISSIGNCIADQAEDAIDHPARIELGLRVGWTELGFLVRGFTAAYCVLLITMVVVVPLQPLPAAMWLIFLVLKIAYSFGPRLKPKRHTATLLLGTISGAMLFVGWCGTSMASFWEAGTASLLLWVFGASLCGSKDVPNLEGDMSAGYRSVYWDIVESTRPLRRALGVVCQPYVGLVVAAIFTELTGGPGLGLLWCLALWPGGAVLAVLIVRARSPEARAFVREYGYLYWLVFMSAVLICFVPTLTTAACAVGGIAYFLLASRVAHPDPVPSWPELRQMRRSANR